MLETWLLLEFCDRGNLDRAIMQQKVFLLPGGQRDVVRRPRLQTPNLLGRCSRAVLWLLPGRVPGQSPGQPISNQRPSCW